MHYEIVNKHTYITYRDLFDIYCVITSHHGDVIVSKNQNQFGLFNFQELVLDFTEDSKSVKS